MASQLQCGFLSTPKNVTKFHAMGNRAIILLGDIRLGERINHAIALVQNERYDSKDKNSPRYDVYKTRVAVGEDWTKANWNHAGAAWIKNAERSEIDFLSITLDDIDWPQPVNVAAFPVEVDGLTSFRIVWSRPRVVSGGGGGGPGLRERSSEDDE